MAGTCCMCLPDIPVGSLLARPVISRPSAQESSDRDRDGARRGTSRGSGAREEKPRPAGPAEARLACSGGGRDMYSGAVAASVAVLDMGGAIATGGCTMRETMLPQGDTVWSMACDASGANLAAGGDAFDGVDFTGFVRIIDLASGAIKLEVVGLPGRVWALAWNPEGTKVGIACGDPVLRIMDSTAGVMELERTLGEKVMSVDWSPDGAKIVAVTYSFLFVMDAMTWTVLHKDEGCNGSQMVAWDPSGVSIAEMSKSAGICPSYQLRVMDATGKEAWKIKDCVSDPRCFSWHPDGTKLAVSHVTDVKIRDAATGNLNKRFEVLPRDAATGTLSNSLRSIAFDFTGTKVAVGHKRLSIIDEASGTVELELDREHVVWAVAWIPVCS